jgi:hypothetical protein
MDRGRGLRILVWRGEKRRGEEGYDVGEDRRRGGSDTIVVG